MARVGAYFSLYEIFRGVSGFTLIVAAASILLSPGLDKVRGRLAVIFLSVGFLFCLSASGPLYDVPTDPANFLVIGAILAISQSYFEIFLYLFGSSRSKDLARRMLVAGAVWALALCLVPYLDYAFGWAAVSTSVEDGASLGPLHSIVSVLIYLWPIAISIIAPRASRFSLRDLPTRAPGTKVLARGAVALMLILGLVLAGTALESRPLYRAGHVAMAFLMLAWFLYASARPHIFALVRKEIHEAHEKNLRLDEAEIRTLAQRIEQVAADEAVLCRTGLTLGALAAIIKVPPYRLSAYFNGVLKTTFPEWLNAVRIERVRRTILAEPGRSILDLAFEAGYASKSVFNHQFQKIVGMNPSEYRRSHAADAGPVSKSART
jgi:AraC-like DNA-binding protein